MPEQSDISLPSPTPLTPERPAPLVSVVIPAYNTARYIDGTLSSVFAQTFSNLEVILINDGSPDSEQMELAIAPYRSRVLYLKQQNGGPSSARNLGIRHARGEWLAFLDSDDTWMPNYLAEQLEFLHADPALDMVYCDAILEGETKAAGKTFMQVCPSTGPVTFESLLAERTQPITSGTVVRRQKVLDAGLFDEEIHCSEDHDLWLRVVYTGAKIAYQRSTLLRRKVRSESQGSSAVNLLAGEMQTLKKLDRDLNLSSSTRAVLAQKLRTIQAALALLEGKIQLFAGEPDDAYESLSLAYSLTPTTRLRAMVISLRIAPRLSVLFAQLWNRRK